MTTYRGGGGGGVLLHTSSLSQPNGITKEKEEDDNDHPELKLVSSPKLEKSRFLVHDQRLIEQWTKEHYAATRRRRRIKECQKECKQEGEINEKTDEVAIIKLQAFVRSSLTRVKVCVMVEKLIEELLSAQQQQQQREVIKTEEKKSNPNNIHGKLQWMNSTTETTTTTTCQALFSPVSSPSKPRRRNVGKVERRRRQQSHNNNHRPTMMGQPRKSSFRRMMKGQQRSISFSSSLVEECPVTPIPRSKSNEFFYGEDDIARFRHYAFIEDAGLDPEEFPFDG